MIPLEIAAARLGLAFDLLDGDEQERLLFVVRNCPAWERTRKVRYIHCGPADGEPNYLPPPPGGLIRSLARTLFMTSTIRNADQQLDDLRCRKIARQLGLSGAVLLPKHQATIAELAKLTASGNLNPLKEVHKKHLQRARELVAELPRTRQAAEWLAVTEHGPQGEARF